MYLEAAVLKLNPGLSTVAADLDSVWLGTGLLPDGAGI